MSNRVIEVTCPKCTSKDVTGFTTFTNEGFPDYHGTCRKCKHEFILRGEDYY